jgi:hypothetical protein
MAKPGPKEFGSNSEPNYVPTLAERGFLRVGLNDRCEHGGRYGDRRRYRGGRSSTPPPGRNSTPAS